MGLKAHFCALLLNCINTETQKQFVLSNEGNNAVRYMYKLAVFTKSFSDISRGEIVKILVEGC